MRLDERKQRVLRAVVEDYIHTAEPVGSRTIARKYVLGVSPATIRNEMADLEELGFLEQPHTSAGRIPSDKGYRLYVDSLMRRVHIGKEEAEIIRQYYSTKVREMEYLITLTARVLSEASRYMAVILGPQLHNTVLKHLQIIPMRPGKALLVLVTDAGFVHSSILDAPEGINQEELTYISAILNQKLSGVRIDQLGRTALYELYNELGRYRTLVDQVMEVLESATSDEADLRIYTGGTSHILGLPEFQDIDRAKLILEVLENESLLSQLLKADYTGIQVSIGNELGMAEMRDCSVVSASYKIGSGLEGQIAVLGPKRMDYSRVFAVVEFMRDQLEEVISGMIG